MKMRRFPGAREEIERAIALTQNLREPEADGETEANGESRPVNLGEVQPFATGFSPPTPALLATHVRLAHCCLPHLRRQHHLYYFGTGWRASAHLRSARAR